MKKCIGLLLISLLLSSCKDNQTNTANYFQSIKNNPSELRMFLQAMPKGGDLHNHLDGAVFAENFIDDANNQTAEKDPIAYDSLIDSFSTRDYKIKQEPGDTQFFSTFAKFGSIDTYPKMLVDVLPTNARQHVDYLELMLVPNLPDVLGVAKDIPWTTNFKLLTDELNQAGMSEIIKKDSQLLDQMTSYSQQQFGCGSKNPQPECNITVRYQFATLRNFPRVDVFAQLLESFEAANQDPRVVGINIVQQENEPLSMHDYDLHMQMIGYLHKLYPNVKISLHAGEMVLGQVPPDYLKDHINKAINIAGADRIGHGVDIASEDHADALLDEMAKKHILVEINLTSNDVILGVHGKDHPIMLYLNHHVPIALSTDDAGVLRTDLTHEYQRAVETYNFDYFTLKNIDRNSLSYAFISGKSLWKNNDTHVPVSACEYYGSDSCKKFLAGSEKAALQYKLETQFAEFEKTYANRRVA
ncbi:MAG TPA: adenosine deaminase [Gammaproteobacteria bacterium]|nr:adenosine deaminase [Gammaproteobacteria bacterium]